MEVAPGVVLVYVVLMAVVALIDSLGQVRLQLVDLMAGFGQVGTPEYQLSLEWLGWMEVVSVALRKVDMVAQRLELSGLQESAQQVQMMGGLGQVGTPRYPLLVWLE